MINYYLYEIIFFPNDIKKNLIQKFISILSNISYFIILKKKTTLLDQKSWFLVLLIPLWFYLPISPISIILTSSSQYMGVWYLLKASNTLRFLKICFSFSHFLFFHFNFFPTKDFDYFDVLYIFLDNEEIIQSARPTRFGWSWLEKFFEFLAKISCWGTQARCHGNGWSGFRKNPFEMNYLTTETK